MTRKQLKIQQQGGFDEDYVQYRTESNNKTKRLTRQKVHKTQIQNVKVKEEEEDIIVQIEQENQIISDQKLWLIINKQQFQTDPTNLNISTPDRIQQQLHSIEATDLGMQQNFEQQLDEAANFYYSEQGMQGTEAVQMPDERVYSSQPSFDIQSHLNVMSSQTFINRIEQQPIAVEQQHIVTEEQPIIIEEQSLIVEQEQDQEQGLIDMQQDEQQLQGSQNNTSIASQIIEVKTKSYKKRKVIKNNILEPVVEMPSQIRN